MDETVEETQLGQIASLVVWSSPQRKSADITKIWTRIAKVNLNMKMRWILWWRRVRSLSWTENAGTARGRSCILWGGAFIIIIILSLLLSWTSSCSSKSESSVPYEVRDFIIFTNQSLLSLLLLLSSISSCSFKRCKICGKEGRLSRIREHIEVSHMEQLATNVERKVSKGML